MEKFRTPGFLGSRTRPIKSKKPIPDYRKIRRPLGSLLFRATLDRGNVGSGSGSGLPRTLESMRAWPEISEFKSKPAARSKVFIKKLKHLSYRIIL